ncbi:serine hydrolase [Actinorhabdospora filicis]|uniref:Beta-lactamase n=1 Tax=Actinorhabdospora filicis TaxID=1785913 RepID=A0A9W6SNH6_9ACTN|nr:serine hydrolase [Actinorhabdospora filicis]GLZ80140.1 serine hydrolase [Actinorhabdospora filicis]
MSLKFNRRNAIGLGASVAAGAFLSAGAAEAAFAGSDAIEAAEAAEAAEDYSPALTAAQARNKTGRIYDRYKWAAGGTWSSYITVADANGNLGTAVDEHADQVVDALSVNKLAIAVAVLDRVDRGIIKLTDTIEVSQAIIIAGGDGMFRLDGAYPSHVTVGHALANLLTISCDTSVRLCGLMAPTADINQILRDKGFVKTQVEPGSNPNRMFMGWTTPREMHQLLQGLVKGTLLSPASTQLIFNLIRSPIAFTDGIRLNLSTPQRMQIATKAGWDEEVRNEAGIIFDATGAPIMTYSMFATLPGSDTGDFGPNHPLVGARAKMGSRFFNIVSRLSGPAPRIAAATPGYNPTNGG